MKFRALPLSTSSALLATTSLFLLGATSSFGTILPITDATYSGSFTAGTPENITGNANLAGLTTTEGTFTGILGATANNVVTSNTPNSLGTAPADAATAATGLTVNDGINNLNSGNFQLGLGTFDANARFFIVENTPTSSTPGDPTTVTLIDASNNAVGTYTLNLTAANFTTSAGGTTATALCTLTYTSGFASQVGVPSKLGGVAFSLSDFTGTGDTTTATGIRLTSGTLDPNVVGAFSVVPEPGSASLIGVGCVLLAAGLRRAKNRRRAA